MPYYEPRPIPVPRGTVRPLNAPGLILLGVVLLSLAALAWVYGPAYCGVIAGRARQATVLIVASPAQGSGDSHACPGFVINSQERYVLTVADALPGDWSTQVFRVIVGGSSGPEEFDAWVTGTGPLAGEAGTSGHQYAIFQVDSADPLVSLEFGDSQQLRIGDRVTAVGFPDDPPSKEQAPAIQTAAGHVSALEAAAVTTDIDRLEAAAGGPLLNGAGQAVGLVVSTADRCVAVPSAVFAGVLQQYGPQPQAPQ